MYRALTRNPSSRGRQTLIRNVFALFGLTVLVYTFFSTVTGYSPLSYLTGSRTTTSSSRAASGNTADSYKELAAYDASDSSCLKALQQSEETYAGKELTLLDELQRTANKETALQKQINRQQRDLENKQALIERYIKDNNENTEKLQAAQARIEALLGGAQKAEQPLANNGRTVADTKPTTLTDAISNAVVAPIGAAVAESAVKAEQAIEQFQRDKAVPNVEAGSAKTGSKANSHGPNGLTRENVPTGTAVLLFTATRGENLQKTIDSLLKYQPPTGNPIFVSQDGSNEAVTAVINSYISSVYHLRFDYVQHPQTDMKFPLYFRIAQHYGYALGMMFDTFGYEKVIVVEDDMYVSPDFYDYFNTMDIVLDSDPSVMCISAWNDNGQQQFVASHTQTYRSDVFPGLGWMLRRSLWQDELRDKWPLSFWDDWLRQPKQTRGRSCVYPEINRVYTFGSAGASAGQFFNKYLEPIKLNDVKVEWKDIDLTPQMKKSTYDTFWSTLVSNAQTVNSVNELYSLSQIQQVAAEDDATANVVALYYNTLQELTNLEEQLGLMSDHKDGIPRASYQGVVPFRYNGRRVLLVPRTTEALPALANHKLDDKFAEAGK